MMSRLNLAAALSMMFAVGCLGSMPGGPSGDDDDTQPPPGRTARQMFDQDVQPLMGQRCQSCHLQGGIGPNFLGTGSATFYSTIENYTSVTACVNNEKCLIT